MSFRWMAVQYLGDTLRLPIVNESDLTKPFCTSVLERDIRRIVVNPHSDNPMTFVPESDNAKLRELCEDMMSCIEIREAFRRPPTAEICKEFADRARELGIEVEDDRR